FLHRLGRGEPLVSPGLARKLLQEFARLKTGDMGTGPREYLTDRERDVLQLVARGATNRAIADGLVISENTVQFHMKNILSKLHLRNRAEVIAWAFEHGLVSGSAGAQTSGSS
ncbi:MAG: response regulator transcription factor, partial [Chloroflexi bacterium]|nr:response regulator transcription factor [Chloroflexota bacterium]